MFSMQKRKIALKAFYDADEKFDHACVSKNPEFVNQAITEFVSAFERAKPYLSPRALNHFDTCLEDMRFHLYSLEEPIWLKKAEKHLLSFSELYELITCCDLDPVRDAEKLLKFKKKCLSEWKKYFDVDVSGYKSDIRPGEYLKEWMDDLYDPCMEDYSDLDKKLSEYMPGQQKA